jgi:hypothetical protein
VGQPQALTGVVVGHARVESAVVVLTGRYNRMLARAGARRS